MKDYIEYGMVGFMFLGLILFFHNRLKSGEQDKTKGLGLRGIQFTTLILALPIVLILALESIISGETAVALVGTVTGYTLSSIANTGKKSSKDESK